VLDTPQEVIEVCAGYTIRRYTGMCWIHHKKLYRYVLDTPQEVIQICDGYTTRSYIDMGWIHHKKL
jgi:outer membrane lipoprotein-sorting protein